MPLTLTPLTDIPQVHAGDDLATLLLDALVRQELDLQTGDVLVLCQKIVSKAEGRTVRLADITPSPFAEQVAQ